MTSKTVLMHQLMNPCCVALKEKYSKLEESRKALRQCVKILNEQVDKLQDENANLRKAFDEERIRADAEREEKSKESAHRVLLEKEIDVLKNEIHSLHEREGLQALDDAAGQEKSKGSAHPVSLGKEVDAPKTEIHLLHERGSSESHNDAETEEKSGESARQLLLEKETDVQKTQIHSSHDKGGSEVHHDTERLQKSKESPHQLLLEKEIDVMKTEMHSLHETVGSQAHDIDGELMLLRKRCAEMEAETCRLKELIEKERLKADCERKKADSEKQEATRVRQALGVEKGKTDEERRLADTERKKVEENKILLEKLKSEVDQARSQLVLKAMKFEEANTNLEAERRKVLVEKSRADSAMAKVKQQEKLAENNQKKAMGEKCRADSLAQLLEEYKQRIQNLQHEVQEKQNVIRERKQMDLEMRKAAELKKIADANEKKALEEKHRADQLARQLEDYTKRIGELQKEISELLLSRSSVEAPVVLSDPSLKSKITKLDMLRKRLKLGKKQVKHAKEVVKLERDRNEMLQQKLNSISHEFVQFLNRIDLLKDCLPHQIEGRDKSKRNDVFITPVTNLNKEVFGKYPSLVNFHHDNELIKSSSLALDVSGTSKHGINCSSSLLPSSGGNSTQCISGIDSKMDSLLRYSNRKMLETSAINSSAASFSDRPLMGSQGKGALSITTSAKLPEVNTNSQSKVNTPAVVAENSSQSPIKTDGVKSGKHCRKRKRTSDAVKSIEHLCSESTKWQMRLEGKLSNLCDMLKCRMSNSFQEKSDFESYLNPEQMRAQMTKKEFSMEEAVLQQFSEDTHGTRGNGEDHALNSKIIAPHKVMVAAPVCEEGMGNFGTNSHEIGCFNDAMERNCMKLLDLDNVADEECYRRAVERPLSPLKPVLEFPVSGKTGKSHGIHSSDEWPYEIGKDNLLPSCSSDVFYTENDSDMKLSCREVSHVLPVSKNDNVVCVAEDLAGNKNCEGGTIYDDRNASAQHIMESHGKLGPESCVSGHNVTDILGQSTLHLASDKLPKYCVVFSDNKDESSICRIFCAMKILIDQGSMSLDIDKPMLKFMLDSLKTEGLLPREKACVVFSVLLWNLSEIGSKIWNMWPAEVIHLSDTFARSLRPVLLDAEIQTDFAEICFSGQLLMLIEDFLLEKRLLVCTDVSTESSLVTGPKVAIFLNEEQITLSCILASGCQLLPGAILLASICVTIDHIGFLCEASYNILRLYKLDNLLVLNILHVFACVCGPKYFTFEEYRLTMTVVRSLVMCLERESVSTERACCLLPFFGVQEGFASSTKCPFSKAAVSMEMVIALLFGELQNYASASIPYHSVEALDYKNIMYHKGVCDSESISCDISCCLKNFPIVTGQSLTCDESFCHFTDVLSLVELVASNMHWDWTCTHIVPQVLKLMDLCALGNFFTVIVIFLCKLGRLGVDAFGYDDKAVETLRSSLSAYLHQKSSKELGFPTQILVVNALLVLVPLDFQELIKTEAKLSEVFLDFANSLRNWYNKLSSDQQSSLLEFLHSTNVLIGVAQHTAANVF